MKAYVVVLLTLVKLAASTVDEELQAKYMTMSQSDFMEHFNEINNSWKIKQYINMTLSILHFDIHIHTDDLPVKYIDRNRELELPENFDSREKWPCCPIGVIRNQHHCGSCWAHGVANTASDRICIHTDEIIDLSEQDLECSHLHQTICYGGLPTKGFQFWEDYGLVPRQCKPYEPLDLNRNQCVRFCKYNPNLKDYMDAKYRAKEVYYVPNDSWQIKAELYLNGPIQAGYKVFEDFRHNNGQSYASGIYNHTHGELVGYHSVRVIGYGVENGVEYWLAANSWGSDWGENGYFRIKSFQPSVGFETLMIAGIPEDIPLSKSKYPNCRNKH